MPELDAGAVTGSTETVLRSYVNQFSQSPLQYGKRIRDLLASRYSEFRDASVPVLRNNKDPRGCRYLVTVLWINGLLISLLTDPTIPGELAIGIADLAAKVDPQLHIHLMQFLSDGVFQGAALDEEKANRLLEILGSITDGVGIQPFIRQMLRHPSPRVRSKVALLIENGGLGVRALRSLLDNPEEDARVRANAIEALWANRHSDVIAVFRDNLSDPVDRVAGNAALGLYLSGDCAAVPALIAMTTRDNASARLTAVWAMGKTKDPRFLSVVGRFLTAPSPAFRRTVFKAVESIKKAVAQRQSRLRVCLLALEPLPSQLQLRISVLDPQSGRPVNVPPTGFHMSLDGESIAHYSVTPQPQVLVSLSFAIPHRDLADDPLRRAVAQAAENCLALKRNLEQWAIVHFRETANGGPRPSAPLRLLGQSLIDEPGEASAVAEPARVVFTGNSIALKAALQAQNATRASVHDVFHRILACSPPSRASRHCIVIAEEWEEISGEELQNLIVAFRAAGTSLHAISIRHNQQLAELCPETSGYFRIVSNAAELTAELESLYSSIKHCYMASFSFAPASTRQSPEAGRDIQIQVHTEEGCGEVSWHYRPTLPSDIQIQGDPLAPAEPASLLYANDKCES